MLTQCDLHSARFGIIYEDTVSTVIDQTKPVITLDGCILHNIGGNGLYIKNGVSQVTNTQISNTLGNTVELDGGSHSFIYCTLAQFYPFVGNHGMALRLASCEDGGDYGMLHKAHFINCVITGYGKDVIQGENIVTDTYTCNFLFHHCFINTPVDTDEHFVDCIFDQDPKGDEDKKPVRQDNFVLFDTENILYDFTPKETSAIRHLADTAYPGLPTVDRRGVSRQGEEGGDAGCYQYVAPSAEEETP